MMKAAKYFAVVTIVSFSLASGSAFSEDPPPPPPPTPMEEIVVTTTYEAPSFWGFVWYLFTGNIGGFGSGSSSVTSASNNDVKKLCATNPDAAKTTSRDSDDSRFLAANAIIQSNMQGGQTRLNNNGRIFTVQYADGGTENYIFSAASSVVARVIGSLAIGSGVSSANC